MKTVGYLAATAVVGLVIGHLAAQEEPKTATLKPKVDASKVEADAPTVVAPAPAAKPADLEAIQGLLHPFTTAFNAGDAKAIAAMYTDDAHVINAEGDLVEGREEIEEEYAALFEENPGIKIEIHPESIRSIGENAIIEDGVNRLIPKEGGTPVVNHYTVVFVKQNGKWLEASVRESAAAQLTPHDHLEDLAWLLGEWVDDAHDSRTVSKVQWSADKNYLIREFTIQGPGREPITGTQRIGWDANSGQIKSWVFDSEGGHGEGLWARLGNDWVIKLTAVLQDGKIATATNYLSQESEHSCRWQTVDRTIGGHVIPVNDEFVMVRRPPTPAPK